MDRRFAKQKAPVKITIYAIKFIFIVFTFNVVHNTRNRQFVKSQVNNSKSGLLANLAWNSSRV